MFGTVFVLFLIFFFLFFFLLSLLFFFFFFFFFNDTATTEIYTLSLHDALPICDVVARDGAPLAPEMVDHRMVGRRAAVGPLDRKSTRLNSSHGYISYAVFCLKKKKKKKKKTKKKK